MKKAFCQLLKTGFYSSIQDAGRKGWRAKGIPLSGPMDWESYSRANRLVGNESPLASLEMTLSGPTLLFNDPVWVVCSGAKQEVLLNGEEKEQDHPFLCNTGDVLQLGQMTQGVRSYLAFLGGLKTELHLGSRSQYAPISPESRIQKGEKLPFISNHLSPTFPTEKKRPAKAFEERDFIRVSPGIEWVQCPATVQKQLFNTAFVIGSNDRMGYRLEGKLNPLEIQPLSGVILPGTIQLSTAGTLLIAMVDSQVTGGYLRVLTIDQEERNFLAQQSAGKKLRLQWVV